MDTPKLKGVRIAVGAPLFDFNSKDNVGIVYGFGRAMGTWYSATSSIADEENGNYGYSVTIDTDNTIYAGAPMWNANKGRVSFYDSYMQHIYNPDPYAPFNFGVSIAFDNGQYIIGAPNYVGSVYFGTRD